jgi:hypothetical protein
VTIMSSPVDFVCAFCARNVCRQSAFGLDFKSL